MITIILIVTFGLLFSVFATQNTSTATIYLGSIVYQDLPVYIIVFASIMVGIFFVGVYHILHWLSVSMTLGDKDKEIKDFQKEISNLTKEVHKLELENTKLKAESENGDDDFDEDTF